MYRSTFRGVFSNDKNVLAIMVFIFVLFKIANQVEICVTQEKKNGLEYMDLVTLSLMITVYGLIILVERIH